MKPLWACPKCSRQFANRNQWHSCHVSTIEGHFSGKKAAMRPVFQRYREAIENIGDVEVIPVKTRIGFHARMCFSAVTVRASRLDCHIVLARRIDSDRFTEVVSASPRNHVHLFQIASADEIDDEMRGWLEEAYSVGLQEHLD